MVSFLSVFVMVLCCVKGCSNRTGSGKSNILFHKFPSNIALCKAWLSHINQANFDPFVHLKVCLEHFEEADKIPNLQYQLLPSASYKQNRPQLGLCDNAILSLKLGHENSTECQKCKLGALSKLSHHRFITTVLSPSACCSPKHSSTNSREVEYDDFVDDLQEGNYKAH